MDEWNILYPIEGDFFYKSCILLLIMTQLRSSCSWMYLVFWYFFLLQRRLYMLYRDFPPRIPHSSVLVIFLEACCFWVYYHWSYYSSQAAAKSFQSRNIICDCFWELACLLISCPKFEVLLNRISVKPEFHVCVNFLSDMSQKPQQMRPNV